MAVKIQMRRGTAAEWSAANPTLSLGEIGYDSTNKKLKTGDGVSAWLSLSFDVGLQGATGLVGATGPAGGGGGGGGATGPQGATGLAGSAGSAGTPGSQGTTGSAGLGYTGLQGQTGLIGPGGGQQGQTGLAGATGLAGSAGTPGSQGLTGAAGLGFTGLQGATGLAGSQGNPGTTGMGLGFTGLQGTTGLAGSQGVTGYGVTGLAGGGQQGVTGLVGATGIGGGGGGSGMQKYFKTYSLTSGIYTAEVVLSGFATSQLALNAVTAVYAIATNASITFGNTSGVILDQASIYFSGGPGAVLLELFYPELTGSVLANIFRYPLGPLSFNSAGGFQPTTNLSAYNTSGTVRAWKTSVGATAAMAFIIYF